MSNSESELYYRRATTGASGIDVDYTDLVQCLAEQLWHDAYEETKRVVRRVARETVGFLNDDRLYVEHVISLPCAHLHKIDDLWSTHSRQHFGLSVQRQIYRDLGGTVQFDHRIWTTFCERVGWQDGEINFSLSSPVGHLPSLVRPDLVALDSADGYSTWLHSGRESGTTLYLFGLFFDRLELCGV